MDIRIRCPECRTKLVVDDELLGQSVRCEECGTAFTVEEPAATSLTDSARSADTDSRPTQTLPAVSDRSERVRDRELFDEDRTIDGYEFDDGRPIRRKPRIQPNALVPLVFGSALALAMLLVAVGLFFAFGFGLPASSTPLPPGAKFRIISASWVANRGFMVEVETVAGAQPPPGRYRIAWRSTDGTSSGHSTLNIFRSSATQIIPALQPRNRTFTIWIESEPPDTAGKVSNEVVLK